MWEGVFGWLDSVRDLCACTAVCREWAALCWRRRHLRLHVARDGPTSGLTCDMAVEVVARRSAMLERLDVIGPSVRLGAHAVSTLLASCTRLAELRLHRCDSNLSPELLEAAAQHPSGAASRLTGLSLCGLRRLNTATINNNFARFGGLRSLSLEACTQVTSANLATIALACPQLTALRLKGCYRIKDEGVVAVIEKCPNLAKLNVQGLAIITDRVIKALTQHHPTTLRALNIWGCTKVSDEAVTNLLQCCTNLEKLVAKFCLGIARDSTFEHLVHTDKLRHLDVQGLEIRDAALGSIGSCLAASLTVLDIRDCLYLTEDGMRSVITACTRLSVLRLRSPFVDDSCVIAAAQHLSRLHTLDLQKSINVTGAAVRALIADDCVCRRSLRILNVLGLSQVPWLEIEALLTALPLVKARTDYDVRPYEQQHP